ncbi:sensor histidine kinase [Methylotuvimicrobium buryatense]|uniref:histidine kinase n=1 Tax=Methylotuvimicrobium buryatense TaxID=95641 RepID=A0A4V1IJT3_METBY|nr:PAS domain-containing sensor histidine kinase [Methylotuvimicrobium buryatense]QCW82505.1 PAS domain-containing sensor histidine kinase [Methylotuvimicrobium buryatense]
MIDELSQFLSTKGLLPHGYCLSWSPPLVMAYVVSETLIFLAYFSMPAALSYFARRRKDFPYQWVLWMFATFIMACGMTHLLGAVLLWQPWYGLDVIFKSATALISIGAAVSLWYVLPDALRLPSPSQLRRVNEQLQAEIIERRRVEEQLRQAKSEIELSLHKERILRAAIVEFSDDAIIGGSADGIITDWNRAAEAMFGYTSKEVLGQSLLSLMAPTQRNQEQMLVEAVGRGQSVRQHELQCLHKNGNLFDVAMTISPIFDKEKKVVASSTIARDITERKHYELEILRLNADLERRVEERTEELTLANQELDSFAYAVSHDLRAPIRALNGFSWALIEDYADELQDQAKEYLQQIGVATRRMNDLIDGLLSLSRNTRGELSRDRVDISSLAVRVLAELSDSNPGRHVDVRVEQGLNASCDKRMIESVISNLLENAWKYTAKQKAASIRVFAQDREGVRYFCVADNGVGFNMANAERLFQPFQRLHHQNEFPGIGIGLATVKRIINRHGGVIEVDSQPSKGAEFCFSLPEIAVEGNKSS